jgi:hypothetical protein
MRDWSFFVDIHLIRRHQNLLRRVALLLMYIYRYTQLNRQQSYSLLQSTHNAELCCLWSHLNFNNNKHTKLLRLRKSCLAQSRLHTQLATHKICQISAVTVEPGTVWHCCSKIFVPVFMHYWTHTVGSHYPDLYYSVFLLLAFERGWVQNAAFV